MTLCLEGLNYDEAITSRHILANTDDKKISKRSEIRKIIVS
jgi:hypothetical protein